MDRMDIVEAHAVLEWDYNVGGWLRERPSNARRMMSTGWQLHRMNFRARADLSFSTLSDDGKQAYAVNVLRWGLTVDEEIAKYLVETFADDAIREVSQGRHSLASLGAVLAPPQATRQG